jgi:hypothetical protein
MQIQTLNIWQSTLPESHVCLAIFDVILTHVDCSQALPLREALQARNFRDSISSEIDTLKFRQIGQIVDMGY